MHKPDLAIVDLGLPDFDGVEVIRRIREWSPMPIIVLSARIQERSKIDALDAGADDYITKPFGVGELLARVRVALRHAAQPPAGSELAFGDVRINFDARQASKDGAEVHFTPIEFRLLACLAQAPRHGGHAPPASAGGLGADARGGHALSARVHEAAARQARTGPGSASNTSSPRPAWVTAWWRT